MDETRILARFISELDYEALPQPVIAHAKGLILDQIGCQIAFSTLPWNECVFELVRARRATDGESTVAGYGLRTSAEDAAFANAAFGHGFEMDDVDMATTSHPGAVIIPTAIAMAEALGVDGKSLIAAVVGGYEALLRAGAGASGMAARGFHATSALGPFGSAAAAGRILGLDPGTMLHALGIAGSGAAGTSEFSASGGGVKRLHAAFAAQFGMRAALLARAGLTGPEQILEGRKGFCQAVSDSPDPEAICRGLGERFMILETGYKPHCCCGAYHCALDAVSAITGGRPVDPETVGEIVVELPARELSHVGRIVEPADIAEAQFSVRFGVALRLMRGRNGFHDYTDETLRDESVLSLARKVTCIGDPSGEKLPEPGSAIVTLRHKDGTSAGRRVDFAKGSPQNPMSGAEVEAKFRELVSRAISVAKADEIVGLVGALEDVQPRRLAALLATAGIQS